MAVMIDNKTCYATTKSGNSISKKAESASNIIDYKGIEKACDNIIKVANDGMKDISDAINKVEIGSEALAIADKNMEPILEEVSNSIKSLPEQSGMCALIDSIKEKALQAYNRKQVELNDRAQKEINVEAQSAEII